MQIGDIKKVYFANKGEIQARSKEFRQVWEKKGDKEIFAELVFCVLTPQSKARTCWQAVLNLLREDVLWSGDENQILGELNSVRFKNKKAKYICEVRRFFSNNGDIVMRSKLGQFPNVSDTRDWLVRNVKGIGYKEASHFLRNVGLGLDMAILDRHVLKNLRLLKVIDDVPNSLSRKRYLEIEKKMKEFARRLNVSMSHLDLVLWCKETGEIFK